MNILELLALLALVLAAAVGVGTAFVAASTLRQERRSTRLGIRSEATYDPKVLADPRSCLQWTLGVLSDAMELGEDGLAANRQASQVVQLLKGCPQLAISEVIDDHALLGIERATKAQTVWIVSTDESIEFEYPGTAVAFSGAVIDNLRRGINYRYFVMDTATTRERTTKLMQLIRGNELDDKLQIHFLPDSYWERLRSSTDELILFASDDASEAFYRFPTPTDEETRRWVKAPSEDATSRLRDLQATWEIATPSVEPDHNES